MPGLRDLFKKPVLYFSIAQIKLHSRSIKNLVCNQNYMYNYNYYSNNHNNIFLLLLFLLLFIYVPLENKQI